MLSQDDLTKALKTGQGAANCCGHFCRLGAMIEGDGYLVHHNGTGSRDTDAQTVHAVTVLGMTVEKLAERISAWITGVHRGERVSLNAA